jgi:2-(1,2-epoxy-1,2-dihydrophenyl)acetyl-CoA isomerase
LVQAPASAIAGIKALFAAAPSNTLHQQLDLEAQLQGEAGRSIDFAEGVRAFQEKRPPRYRPG